MRPAAILVLCVMGTSLAPVALAQPADLPIPAATTTELPVGVAIRGTGNDAIYVDEAGHTLYGLDMRTVHRWSPNPAMHCAENCDPAWVPMLAADQPPNISFPPGFSGALRQSIETGEPFGRRGAIPEVITREDGSKFYTDPQKAPDWTVIEGPQGPQWVYQGWHLVFTRQGEEPGSSSFDGAGNFTWNSLKFVPPPPEIVGPPQVANAFVDGAYALTDVHGRLLFTGTCESDCAGWTPLAAGMANRGMGEWQVDRQHESPRWTWRGQPVFVARGDTPATVPDGAALLRPVGKGAR